MSDFQAIGGVSATLQKLLKDKMEQPPGVTALQITISTPQQEEKNGQSLEDPRVNLFLYRVTENGFLKNQEIPGQGHPGSYGKPPLGLDLHYLLTAYGSTSESVGNLVNEIRAHYLLGSAMRVLHEYPVITEKLKTKNGDTILHEGLRGEFEKVKISLEPISLEDISKVWTALTLPYRLSAAYRVSVVQIESRRQKRIALPVLDLPRDKAPRVYATTSKHPRISEVSPTLAGVKDTLTIHGDSFASDAKVKIGRLTLPAKLQPDGSLQVVIPQDKYPDGTSIAAKDQLRAGPQTVQVANAISTLPGKALLSNMVAFMLIPKLTSVQPKSGKAGDDITVKFTPHVRRDDHAYLFVGDQGIPAPPLAKTTTSSDTLKFTLPEGDEKIQPQSDPYPLRLRINGAESEYELADDPPKPKWGLTVKSS